MNALECVLGEGQALLLGSWRQIRTDEGPGRGVGAAAVNAGKDHVSRQPRLLESTRGQPLHHSHPQFTRLLELAFPQQPN